MTHAVRRTPTGWHVVRVAANLPGAPTTHVSGPHPTPHAAEAAKRRAGAACRRVVPA